MRMNTMKILRIAAVWTRRILEVRMPLDAMHGLRTR